MLFIVFGISWYATLLLMRNEQEKRDMLDDMWQSRMALYASNEQLENEVRDRKQAQEELRLRSEHHQIIMDQTTDILFEWGIRKDTLNFSSNWRKKFGYDPIGGDEFLVYLPEVENEDAALWKAEKLHAALGLLTPEQDAPAITCSIGMAVFPHGSVEYDDFFKCADTALYERKDMGRNGVTMYDKRRDEGGIRG